MNMMKETEHVFRLIVPFSNIFTTVYLVKTEDGALLFDAATYPSDFEEHIQPFLAELGVEPKDLKYLFISHNHEDHNGTIAEIFAAYPNLTLVARSPKIPEKYPEIPLLCPDETTELLRVLRCVPIPGHSRDSCALLDTRTNTLISGDCLQLYGIYGSGKWGANISLIDEHFNALAQLEAMEINLILTAHDYHPMGYKYIGKEEILAELRNCRESLLKIAELIRENPALTDAEIVDTYCTLNYPTPAEHVVRAVRQYFEK
ncbi:MAG: MBL fold metallo-hydrolase [Clostridia bacterium]|nr:MBL fold metallo-hydrolase [Clostridia bacterium]